MALQSERSRGDAKLETAAISDPAHVVPAEGALSLIAAAP